VNEEPGDHDAADGRRAQIAQRPIRVRPQDRPRKADQDESTDKPAGRVTSKHGHRSDDRDIRHLKADPVVNRQIHQVRPLDEGDRADGSDQARDPECAETRRQRQDERERRIADRALDGGPPGQPGSRAKASEDRPGARAGKAHGGQRHEDDRGAADCDHASRRTPMTMRSTAVRIVPASSSGPNGPQAPGPATRTATAKTDNRAIRPGLDRIPR